ncbi:hypothetical protein [Sansalvadorimonas verongulae]|uniref:hypothetical protein n=1 Tax=Sansalvadorimonas verongulae TaxID=2172824 RepID=UPI0012BD5F71|nr:hypothetical protein [Sansalvadorimonas verongulae]MTI11822.1 hypothetical protein [Sansalvadorimonas verongulae]
MPSSRLYLFANSWKENRRTQYIHQNSQEEISTWLLIAQHEYIAASFPHIFLIASRLYPVHFGGWFSEAGNQYLYRYMAVYEGEPGSAEDNAVKAGGAQDHYYFSGQGNLVFQKYETQVYLDSFVRDVKAPASNGCLSHSLAVSPYSE